MALKSVSSRVNRGRGGPRKHRKTIKKAKILDITSLIDILTILLVFLIKNISFDIERNSQPEGMTLPTSFVNEQELLKNSSTLLVKIYPNKVLYGLSNLKVGGIESVSSPNLIKLLKMDAEGIRENGKEPVILLLADKKVKCKYITNFMQVTAKSSFHKIFFSAIKSDSRKL